MLFLRALILSFSSRSHPDDNHLLLWHCVAKVCAVPTTEIQLRHVWLAGVGGGSRDLQEREPLIPGSGFL